MINYIDLVDAVSENRMTTAAAEAESRTRDYIKRELSEPWTSK